MQQVVSVRLQEVGKLYPYDPGQLDLQPGDKVIVDTQRGMECGTVMTPPREVAEDESQEKLSVVHRKANEQDLQRLAENREREQKAYAICVQKIHQHELAMKLVKVEYTFDRNKIVFYFTADGRIDFRELVKDLASVFHTRIELRQIGVRDEAKIMGGIGCCGRPLCCASFLGEFQPVSIRMAKEQNLSLNPTKISGICGRLMCCLKYENDTYCAGECMKRRKPQVQAPTQGSRVATVDGDGKVISTNEQRRTATILLDSSRTIVAPWEDIVEKDEEETRPDTQPVETEEKRPPRERRNQRQRRSRRPRHAGGEEQDNRHRDGRKGQDKQGRQHRPHRDNRGPREQGHESRRHQPRDRHNRRDNSGNRNNNNGGKEPQA